MPGAAAGGVSYATVKATGSAVNIVDPIVATQAAHVSATGNLQVTGSVTATPAIPSNLVSSAVTGLNSGSGCVMVIAPPSGKAMVLKQVTVDTFFDPSPGNGQNDVLYKGTTCGTPFVDVNPPTVGATVLPLEPGIAIPAGTAVWARAGAQIRAEVYAYGYAVSSSSVPASAAAGPADVPQQGAP
jgi:hypothetical protein